MGTRARGRARRSQRVRVVPVARERAAELAGAAGAPAGADPALPPVPQRRDEPGDLRGRGRGHDHQINLMWVEAFFPDKVFSGLYRQKGGALAFFLQDPSLFDSGSGRDPLIGGLDHGFQQFVGEYEIGHIAPHSCYRRCLFAHFSVLF